MSHQAPSLVGRFRILAEHGRDGIARIVTASDGETSQMVTLDILDGGDEESRQTVLTRAKACSAVKDPNLYTILEVIEDHDPPLIVREHERGMSLGQHLENEGPFDPHDAGQLIARLGRVLDRCHARRIVHGRMSVELLRQSDPDGPFRIASFGRPLAALNKSETHLERLRYMSPEQIKGEIADDRSDLYALGLIFYALLAGRPAFEAKDPMLLAAQIGEADMPDLAQTAPHVPENIRAIVRRLTAIDPADRFRTGNALSEALERILAKTPLIALPSQPQSEPVVQLQPPQPAKPVPSIYWPSHVILLGSVILVAIIAFIIWQRSEVKAPDPVISIPEQEPPETAGTAGNQSTNRLADRVKDGAPETGADVSKKPVSWHEIAQQARRIGCTQIEAIQSQEGLRLDGLTDDPTLMIDLDSQLMAASSVSEVSWTALAGESPPCAFIKTLIPVTDASQERLLHVQTSSLPAALSSGDLLVIDVDIPIQPPPGGLWHILAGYVTSDGQLIDLSFGDHAAGPQQPGNALRIGDPARGEWFKVASPAGVEVAFVVLSGEPIPNPLDRIEDAASGASRLAELLATKEPKALLSIVPVTVSD